MDDPTSLLFGLDEDVVVEIARVEGESVRVVIETRVREGGCPSCGVLSARVKDRPLCRNELDAYQLVSSTPISWFRRPLCHRWPTWSTPSTRWSPRYPKRCSRRR